MADRIEAGIIGLGTYLPPQLRTNDFWKGRLRPRTEADRQRDILAVERSGSGGATDLPREVLEAIAECGDDLFRGARTRHVISDEMEVSDMEAEAVRRALEDARVRAEEIDLVLVHSLLPDTLNPSDGPAIVAKAGLANATAWLLDVGCGSVPPQLVAATALIRCGMFRKIAIVCSAASSRFLDYDDPQSVGFGDGAAAAIIGPVSPGYGVLGHWSHTNGALRDGVALAPVIGGKPQRRWDRFTGPVRLASFNVDHGKLAGINGAAFCREACMNALANAGFNIPDVRLYVGAQSQGWFIGACRRALGIPAENTISTFAEIANIGAASVLFNLHRARETGRLVRGDLVLMYSPGAGFTQASVVCRWH